MTSRNVFSLTTRASILFAAALLSCGGSTDSSSGGGGTTAGQGGAGASGGSTAGQGGTGAAGTGGAGATGGTAGSGGAGGSGGTLPAAVVCNGVQCASNEQCCLTSGKCFDPASNAADCLAPTDPGPQGQKACGATSQCGPGEYCLPASDQLCLGPGYCVSTTNCPSSSGGKWCGCNGVTYPDVQTACAAGVPLIGMQACGETTTVGAAGGSAGKKVTYCATNANCPTGQQCCGITGQCYDPAKPALCSLPPPGTKFPCVDDTQCFQGVEYCYAEGCDGPGGCVNIPGSGDCTGELDPVCGCNGKSYVNAKCAAVDGVRIAHAGQCP